MMPRIPDDNGVQNALNQPDDLDEVVARCLRTIESGGATVEQCAASFPNYPELADLLYLALSVQNLPRPDMPARAVAQSQRRLIARYRQRMKESAASRRTGAFGWRLPILRFVMMVIVAGIVLFGSGALLVRASANTIPGDTLYPVKRSYEYLRLHIESDQPHVLDDIAGARIQEITIAADQRRQPVSEAMLNDMSSSIQQALTSEGDSAKRAALTLDATNTVQDAAQRGAISFARASSALNQLAQVANLSPNNPNNGSINGTQTAIAIAQTATASASNGVLTATPGPSLATVTPTVPTSTPTATASATALRSSPTTIPTSTPSLPASASIVGIITATPAPSFTLGPGPAVIKPGLPTTATQAGTEGAATSPATVAPTEGGTEAPTEISTESPTAEGTAQATAISTEAGTQAVAGTASATRSATPKASKTPVRKPTRTPRPSATPKAPPPPSVTPTPTPTPALPSADFKQPWQQITYKDCKPEGTGGDPLLNMTRNRVDEGKYQQTDFGAVAQLIWPKDAEGKPHGQWSPTTAGQIGAYEGLPLLIDAYVVKAQANGPEAQNCNSKDDVTWQLWALGASGTPGDLTKAVVAGITPRVRANHPGWTLDKLNALAAADAHVRISGWLMFNPEQADEVGKTRQGLWEIHPLMQISVQVDKEWVSLDDYQPKQATPQAHS